MSGKYRGLIRRLRILERFGKEQRNQKRLHVCTDLIGEIQNGRRL